MKVKKIAAVAAGTVLIASLALSASACAKSGVGEGKINIADFTEKYEGSVGAKKYGGLSEVLTLTKSENIVQTVGNVSVITDTSSVKYKIFDWKTEKYLFEDLANYPELTNINGLRVIKLTSDSGTMSAYYTFDGTNLLGYGEHKRVTSATHSYRLSNEGDKKHEILTVTAEEANETEVKSYFKVNRDRKTGDVTYTPVNPENIVFNDTGYPAGTDINRLKEDIYDYDSDTKPVTGEITNYQVSVVGTTYTFYKNGEVSGSLKIENGDKLGYLGDCLYYYTLDYTDPESTKGYNMMIISEGVAVKANYSLHCYDILKNKTKDIDKKLAVLSMSVLYNYSNECYDAAVIYGYEMKDGIAVVSSTSTGFKYAVDRDFKLAYDLQYANSNVIKDAGNGNYLLGNYLINSDFAVLNSVNGEDGVYKDEQLLSFSSNGLYGFTDYSGKVVIEPKYTSASSGKIEFYGGYAYVNMSVGEGETKEVFLNVNGETRDVPEQSENVIFNVYDGYYLIGKVNGAATTYECYNFAGDLIHKFGDGSGVAESYIDGNLYVKEVKSDGSQTISKFTYAE